MNSVLHARAIYKALIEHEAAIDAVGKNHPSIVGTDLWSNMLTTKDHLHRALNRMRRASVDWLTFKALMLAGDDAQIAAALNDDPPANPQSGGTNKDDDDNAGG